MSPPESSPECFLANVTQSSFKLCHTLQWPTAGCWASQYQVMAQNLQTETVFGVGTLGCFASQFF